MSANVASSVPVVQGVDVRRCRRLNSVQLKESTDPVIYWMSRDQRSVDNWALIYAQKLAIRQSAPLHVVFSLVPKFLDATLRQYDFLLKGLREVAVDLESKNIPFHLQLGKAGDKVPALVSELSAQMVVCDMSPLRVPSQWARDVADACQAKEVPVVQVDAHNVVPVWAASDKQETAARTIRKKIMQSLGTYLTDFPRVEKHPHKLKGNFQPVDWVQAEQSLQVDDSVRPVAAIVPGTAAGLAALEDFCKRLSRYDAHRNDPNDNALSGLSPWLHFGQISAQRCALRVRLIGEIKTATSSEKKSCEAFIEESVVRRELSDNFCFYNVNYDSLEGAAGWAQQTLKDHSKDKREHLYCKEELENAKTHDDLWNAAQLQMVREGKMHGFLRMYWAKKILEWSPSPKEALERCIWLNDRYELDGRDPNGYVGCMWSVCGAWHLVVSYGDKDLTKWPLPGGARHGLEGVWEDPLHELCWMQVVHLHTVAQFETQCGGDGAVAIMLARHALLNAFEEITAASLARGVDLPHIVLAVCMNVAEDPDFAEFAGEKEHVLGRGTIRVRTYEDFMQNAIGGVVTRAAKDLATWAIEVSPHATWHGCQAVELGAGCCLVSSVLMKLGAAVVATDLPELLPHMEYNLKLNDEGGSALGRWAVDSLNWDSAEARVKLRGRLGNNGADAIFATNCVYGRDTVDMFLSTMFALSGPRTLALMCGVPVPPAALAPEEVSILDEFLAACPRFFDCYLLKVPGGIENAGVARVQDSPLAAELGKPYGLSAAALADGVWLFKLPGSDCPSWARPVLCLGSGTTLQANLRLLQGMCWHSHIQLMTEATAESDFGASPALGKMRADLSTQSATALACAGETTKHL
ncbi:PHR [Symbiodinium sp. CCMP2456]|nr:PHR [Symbiodinium sp. CCMP2456]